MPADERRLRFEEIYSANHHLILGYLLRRTHDPQDAADLLGQTFLTAWQRIDTVPSGDKARPWLYGVARHTLANHHRRERRRSDLTAQLRIDVVETYQPPEYNGDLSGIAAAFRGLPEADQELLALVGWEGLDHGQIAEVLGCSRNAVRIRLYRARKRFSRALDRTGAPTLHLARTSAANGGRAA